MGFCWATNEQRLRINLSKKAYLTMTEDMVSFHEAERSSFINIVFKNYRDQAKASVSCFLERQKTEFLKNIEAASGSYEMKLSIAEHLFLQEQKKLLKYVNKLKQKKCYSRNYRINNENLEFLTSDECMENQFYDNRIGIYLKCILEEYAELPYSEREKIYFRESYDLVESAIRTQSLLKVTTENGLKFHVHPYKMIEDPLATRWYLAGYSSPISGEKKLQTCSFRVPRLKNIQILKQSGHLTRQEISVLEHAIEKRTVQFLLSEEEEIRIYLTDEGIKEYNKRIYLRPVKDDEASTEHEYVFHCTTRQAEYFFFRFGANAKVLKPESLRQHFAEMYAVAHESYQ